MCNFGSESQSCHDTLGTLHQFVSTPPTDTEVMIEQVRTTLANNVWLLFWLTIVETACFGIIMGLWQFHIIDEMYHAQDILAHIASMTPLQRQVHRWMTATLDVLYPFTYASYFIGMAYKAFPAPTAFWLSLPAILCIPVDLVEGYSQVLLLSGGHDEMVSLKVVVTPLKLVLSITSLVVSLVGVVRLQTRKERRD